MYFAFLSTGLTIVCGLSLQYCFGMQTHLAMCCKSLLPILGMGHVRVNLDKPASGRPLLKATRCLTKQPGGASHLEVFSWASYCEKIWLSTRNLIDLRWAHIASVLSWC